MHRKFLEDANPQMLAQLHQSGDLNSYLFSVGETANEMLHEMMRQHQHSEEVRALPHMERVRALQNRLMEADEVVRRDVINQPLPEDETPN
jgi:hypothetical protein